MYFLVHKTTQAFTAVQIPEGSAEIYYPEGAATASLYDVVHIPAGMVS